MKSRYYPIDAVITWVDGDDERHKAKRMRYGNWNIFQAEDIAAETRFSSVGEIGYCVASINRFAPWINKIYIVTDEQNPHIEDFMDKHFPEREIPIEIVDHKILFVGYEEYLPTFNSISIESMTWRIPKLSEHYIEFNDDFMLAAPTKAEDFFTVDGKVICYGKKYCSLLVGISRFFKRRKNGEKKVTFKETMLNGASVLGYKWFFIKFYHTPRALLKSVYRDFFNTHNELLARNISFRFRSYRQFNPQEIQYMLLYHSKRCILRDACKEMLYLKPKKESRYTMRKLEFFDKRPDAKFACINSLDRTSKHIQNLIKNWIEKRIGI